VLSGTTFAYDALSPQIESDKTETDMTFRGNDAKDPAKIDAVTEVVIPLFLQAFGAFAGFIGALYISNRDSRKQSKELDDSLRDELTTLRDELEERIKLSNDYLMFRYSIPAWDSSLTSGLLSAQSSHSVYKKYVKIYSLIQYAQELEKEYTQSKIIESLCATENGNSDRNFIKEYVNLIDEERVKCARNIHSDIGKLLGIGEVS